MSGESEKTTEASPVEEASERMQLYKQVWGKRKITRLNKIIDPDYCGALTVRDLAAIVLVDKMNFPKGLDTPLAIGDFEGNFSTNVLSVTTAGSQSDHICMMGDPNGYME